MAAELGIVSCDAVADLEIGNLGSDGGDDAHGLVAGDQRELGNEFTLVDVLQHRQSQY